MFESRIICICGFLIFGVISYQQINENVNQLINRPQNDEPELTPDNVIKVQFPNTSDLTYQDETPAMSQEVSEDGTLTDLFSRKDVKQFRSIVSSILGMGFYDEVFRPFENGNTIAHRRSKRESDSLVNNLNKIVANIEKMVESTDKSQKEQYLNQAATNLDDYIRIAKSRGSGASANSTIQIMKLENVMLVQCAGWLWYPINRINKTITCSNGIMRFEGRDRTVARACDVYNCIDLAI